jgi:hypothetical protein
VSKKSLPSSWQFNQKSVPTIYNNTKQLAIQSKVSTNNIQQHQSGPLILKELEKMRSYNSKRQFGFWWRSI